MNRTHCLMASLLMSVNIAFAQKTVSGKVLDKETKEALPGVVLLIPNSAIAVISSADGNYTLSSEHSFDSIEVKYTGYETQKLKTEDHLNIQLSSSLVKMDEVVITASRESEKRSDAPIAISKISATTINDAKATLLTELINKVSGVAMLNLNNEQHGMSIRQPMGTSNYFLYMEDGIPMRPMGVFNHNALIEMNLFAISGIEVVKGPASSLYGPEAVGGAINFITQKPTAVLTAKAGIQADNFGYKRVQYGSGGMITKKLGFYVGGYYAQQKNGWITNSDYDKNSVNARLDFDLTKKTKLIFSGAYHDYYSETGGSVDSTAFYSRQYISTTDFTYRKVNSLRTRLTVEQKWNETNNTSLHLFYRKNTIAQNPAYSIRWTSGKTVATGQVNDNSLQSRGFILQHSTEIPKIRTKIIAGVSLDNSPNTYDAYQVDLNAQLRSDGKSVEKYTINQERKDVLLANYDADIFNYAAYSQVQIKPCERLTVTLGGRYDVMNFDYSNYLDNSSGKKSYQQFSPKAGITYNFIPEAGVYVNYAQGFSPPGLTAVFTRKPNSNPVEFYYDLEAPQFTNCEAGAWASLIKNKLDLDITFYQLNGKNELLNIRQPDNSTDYQSAGKTLHQGIEYGLNFRPTKEWLFRFSGTNAKHQFEEFVLSTKANDPVKDVNGKIMPSAPSFIANAEIMFKPIFLKGFKTGIEWQHMSPWYRDQINTVKYDDKGAFGVKGISVLNFRVGYNYKSFEVFGNIMNLTDELYAFNVTKGNSSTSPSTFTPAPPRTFVLGIQYNFTAKQ